MKNLLSVGLGLALALGSMNLIASDEKKPAKKEATDKKDNHKDPHHKDDKKPKKDH